MTEQRFTFDAIAETYARVRPGYPDALVDDLIAGAGLTHGNRVLEIGSGPGVATASFVERGFQLLCVEPGPQMGAVARARFAGERVEVLTSTFEDWPVERDSFALAFAAQSFHWVDPAVRCVKAHQALAPGGTLAIFANRPHHADTALDAEIQAIYKERAPTMIGGGALFNTVDIFRAIFEDSGLFDAPVCNEYPWEAEHTTEDYLSLLTTFSDHRLLPDGQRAALMHAVGEAIDRHGGVLRVPHVAVLAHARAIEK